MKHLQYIYTLVLFFIAAELLPKEIKEPIPRIWGAIEGTTGLDHTGFAFTPYGGQGNCRIVNARIALKTPGSKIVFGMIKPLNGRSYPHLWVTDKDLILDASCQATSPNCQDRKPFAIIDPITLKLEMENPTNDQEKHQIAWGLEYLSGLKTVSSPD
jgi:hypothetical protein